MQYTVVAYVAADTPHSLDLFPQVVLDKAGNLVRQYRLNAPSNLRYIGTIGEQLISAYNDTRHMRYIIMLYMLIQEIEEIEVKSIDDISSDVNDNQNREDWDSSQPRYGY